MFFFCFFFFTGTEIGPQFGVKYLAMHVPKYRPYISAMMALDSFSDIQPMTYTYTKTSHTSYVLVSGQRHLHIDQPFNNFLPQKTYLFCSYKKDTCYFTHNDFLRLTVMVNNSSLIRYFLFFPLRIEKDHLLDREGFEHGRSLSVLDLKPQHPEVADWFIEIRFDL